MQGTTCCCWTSKDHCRTHTCWGWKNEIGNNYDRARNVIEGEKGWGKVQRIWGSVEWEKHQSFCGIVGGTGVEMASLIIETLMQLFSRQTGYETYVAWNRVPITGTSDS